MFLIQKHASALLASVLSGRNLDEVLGQLRQTHPELTVQQRGALQDICFGTLRHRGLLEQILNQLLRTPLHEPELRTLLLAAIYQLQFTRAAPYSIVDHAVKVAAHTGKGTGKGLVNAVLRNFLRNREALLEQARTTQAGRHSHPDWWIARMRSAYPEQWEEILAQNNQHPPMTLRVNLRKVTVEDYLALLAGAQIEARPLGMEAIQLAHPLPVGQLPHFFDGWVSVQDYGAQFAAHLLDIQDGQRVLDACAAPGGKCGHILELASVDLHAVDINQTRLDRVSENLDRLGLEARLIAGNAADPQGWWDGRPFDRILADVPCSASGVVRRHPDIKWLRRPGDFAVFARQQAEMVDALWPLLAKGGKLLYATCSVFPAENAEAAAAFASRHPDAEPLALPDGAPANGQLLPTPEHDGFYYALFRKTG